MTARYVGQNRSSAFWRVVGLFVIAISAPVIVTVALGAGLLYMLVDVLTRGVTNRGASGNGMIMGGLKGIFMWFMEMLKWIFTGREFPGFVPSRA